MWLILASLSLNVVTRGMRAHVHISLSSAWLYIQLAFCAAWIRAMPRRRCNVLGRCFPMARLQRTGHVRMDLRIQPRVWLGSPASSPPTRLAGRVCNSGPSNFDLKIFEWWALERGRPRDLLASRAEEFPGITCAVCDRTMN